MVSIIGNFLIVNSNLVSITLCNICEVEQGRFQLNKNKTNTLKYKRAIDLYLTNGSDTSSDILLYIFDDDINSSLERFESIYLSEIASFIAFCADFVPI